MQDPRESERPRRAVPGDSKTRREREHGRAAGLEANLPAELPKNMVDIGRGKYRRATQYAGNACQLDQSHVASVTKVCRPGGSGRASRDENHSTETDPSPSMSVSRLENTIEPMAERVAALHGKVKGELDVKIAEIQTLMKNMTGTEGSPRAWSNSVGSGHALALAEDAPVKDRKPREDLLSAPPYRPRGESDSYRYPLTRRKAHDPQAADVTSKGSHHRPSRDADGLDHDRHALSPMILPLQGTSFGDDPPGLGNGRGTGGTAGPSTETVQSRGSKYSNAPPKLTVPRLTDSPRQSIPPSASPISTFLAQTPSPFETAQTSPTTLPMLPPSMTQTSPTLLPMLPPSAIPPHHSPRHTPSHSQDSSSAPTVQFVADPSHRPVATDLEQALFERELARDSAVLCEV